MLSELIGFKFLVYAVLQLTGKARMRNEPQSLNIIQTLSKKKGLPEISDET